jgi:hypothetical protein
MFNVSYINWIVIILLFTIFFTPWRKLNNKYIYLDALFLSVLFFFCFSQFYFLFNI